MQRDTWRPRKIANVGATWTIAAHEELRLRLKNVLATVRRGQSPRLAVSEGDPARAPVSGAGSHPTTHTHESQDADVLLSINHFNDIAFYIQQSVHSCRLCRSHCKKD